MQNSEPNFSTLRNSGAFPSSNNKTAALIVDTKLTQKLLQIVADIQRFLSGDHSNKDKSSSEFPILPGSYLTLNNPALEFIKTVTHVLSLEEIIDSEVKILRKGLLRIINIGEFAEESKFKNPCLSFVLNDVICGYCNFCVDMDILRDPNLMNEKWNCIQCGHEYDKSQIEGRLVEILQKKTLNYQLQDLICEKCKQVKDSNCVNSCSVCKNGKFVCKISPETFKQSIVVFRNIASYHKMEWLGETIQFLLGPNEEK